MRDLNGMESLVGHRLASRYDIQALIGQGGMGIVYRGYDTQLNRPVAIKVLVPELSADARFVQRFRQEAIAAANLGHRNIITILDVGQEEDVHFIVMELLQGTPLSRWVQRRGPLSPGQASRIMAQVASALDYAHARHVIQCDVKPANIMVDRRGHATLMDFGLVRARAGDGQSGEMIAGTPEYMAPEQVLGQPVDHRADIYACGAVLYYLLTGQAPFERTAPAAVAYAQVHEPPSSPRKLRPDLPKAVEAVMLKALAKQPADRYQSAGALAADFAVALTGSMPPGLKKRPTPDSMPSNASQPLPEPAGSARASQVMPASDSEENAAAQVRPTPSGTEGAPPATAQTRPWRASALAAGAILVMLIVVMAGLAWTLARSTDARGTPTTTIAGGGAAAPTAELSAAASASATPGAVAVPPPARTVAPRTVTLAPTASPAPTLTATRATAEPSPTSLPLEAPRLVAPEEGFSVSGDVLFQWEWEGALAPGLAFEIRLWKDGSNEHPGAYELVGLSANGRMQQRVAVGQTPAVRQAGKGLYWWTVAVVRAEPYDRVGPEAPPRRLYYSGTEPGD